MTESSDNILTRARDWVAYRFGISPKRKEEIYIELSRSASLGDVTYWLQLIFSAGIATLGLILSSPAVIIGAMLISPLMGPILASGLALSSGDFVLGTRAVVSLAISCLVAVIFALVLVAILPFKELTAEIVARTEPNTLDLVIALFSGAIGSIAICREVRGVVTSIPGVAIAVALMPPLCVVGFGLGLALTLNAGEGMRVAGGGALLFLTNLCAITFTAMLVFLLLHIDTNDVRTKMREWRSTDRESMRFHNVLRLIPGLTRIRAFGGLSGRFIMISIVFLALLIPLTSSFNHLSEEIARKRDENNIQQAATALWRQNFVGPSADTPRSYIGSCVGARLDGRIVLQMRVFTNRTYSGSERDEYRRLVAARLNVPSDSVVLQLIEIPTTSSDLLTRSETVSEPVPLPPTIAELSATLHQQLNSVLTSVRLPTGFTLVDYRLETTSSDSSRLTLMYLSGRDVDSDARTLIAEDIRSRLELSTIDIGFEKIDTLLARLEFRRYNVSISAVDSARLVQLGFALQRVAALRIGIIGGHDSHESATVAQKRTEAVSRLFTQVAGISADRVEQLGRNDSSRIVEIKPLVAPKAR